MAKEILSLAQQLDKKDLLNDVTVSFEGNGLKFDSEADIRPVCDALEAQPDAGAFCLQGNTLGSDAAAYLGNALKNCSKLKRLMFADVFTGRLKADIPISLEHISNGLISSGCQLHELDFSGNAFGELGINALYGLLTSPACFSLKELRLHNTGLGPSGGKLLAKALLACHENSEGTFRLKIFVCGRSRLENDGAVALADFFAKSPDLEELIIPQNGILKEGIASIITALTNCHRLKVLNLTDNILTSVGAQELTPLLKQLNSLEELDIGDCLLTSEGAVHLCDAIKNFSNLRKLHLDHNEINLGACLQVIEAVRDKRCLELLDFNGNSFNSFSIACIKHRLKEAGLAHALVDITEDDSENEEDEDDVNEDDGRRREGHRIGAIGNKDVFTNFKEFASNPTPEALLSLGTYDVPPFDQAQTYLNGFQSLDHESLLRMFVKFASAANSGEEEAVHIALQICRPIMDRLMQLPIDSTVCLINLFAVYLGFVKDEAKVVRAPPDISGSLLVLSKFLDHFSKEMISSFRCFVQYMEPSRCSEVLRPKILDAFTAF